MRDLSRFIRDLSRKTCPEEKMGEGLEERKKTINIYIYIYKLYIYIIFIYWHGVMAYIYIYINNKGDKMKF